MNLFHNSKTETLIQAVDGDIAKRLLFAAFNAHGKVEISKDFSELFYFALSKSIYSLQMGDDWQFLVRWMRDFSKERK